MTRYRDVLSNRNFFFLWFGQVISNFGDRLNQMALVALVYQKNPGSEMALAKLISFTIIPVFVIGPIAGAWVDRLNRRKVMLISDILRGTFVLLLPLFIITNQMAMVYLTIFITFSIARFFIPSKMAIIPDLVTKDKLLVANTLNDTTHMIGNVVGLVVAGLIVNIAWIGAIGGFYIDSATFFVSAVFIAMINKRGFTKHMKEDIVVTGKAIEESIRRTIVGEIKEGLGHLTKYRDMRFVIYVFGLLMAGIGTISCVIIVFIQQVFKSSTRDLGLLGMFLVAGLFLGAFVYGKYFQKVSKHKAIYASFIMGGAAIIAFAAVVSVYPNLLIGGLLVCALGLTVSPIMVATNTLTHETIPVEVRGRIFSSLEAVIHLAFLGFMFIAAFAAKFIDRLWIIIAVGVVYIFCGAARLITSSRRTGGLS